MLESEIAACLRLLGEMAGSPIQDAKPTVWEPLATGCAAWALVRLSRLRVIATEDQEPGDKRRHRSQIVHTVESWVSVAPRTASFSTLMAWFTSITEEMRKRWPEARDEPRGFPTFASESSVDD